MNELTSQTSARFRSDFANLSSLSGEERLARQQDLNGRFNADWWRGARGILNPNQLSRYQQLYYQFSGFSTLADPMVARRLNLTEAQRDSLRGSVDWSRQQLQAISQVAATDPARAAQMYNQYQQQSQERVNQFLTPEQQNIWREMIGDPFTFQASTQTGR